MGEVRWKETKLKTNNNNKKFPWFNFGSLRQAVLLSLCEDQDRRCRGGTEDAGQARLDLQALTSPCIFAGIAEDLLLHSALSSAQQLCKHRPKLVLGCWLFFFCCYFGVLFVCFVLFFSPKYLKITTTLVTWQESLPVVEASREVNFLWWHLLADKTFFNVFPFLILHMPYNFSRNKVWVLLVPQRRTELFSVFHIRRDTAAVRVPRR